MSNPTTNETYSEVTNGANWTMTVERKETRTGKVSYSHTVFYKGEIFDTRNSKREYRAYWVEVADGRRSYVAKSHIDSGTRQAAEYRKQAAKGGEYFGARNEHFHSPEQFNEWADKAEKRAKENRAILAEVEAAGPAYDWKIVDGGFCGRPGLAKGNVRVTAAH